MKNWFKSMAIGAVLLGCTTTLTQAQERGERPDPAEFRQRMMERMREEFGVTDDAEWKVIEAKIEKVNEARRGTGGGFGGGMAFGRRGGGQGGDGERGGRGRGGFGGGGEPNP